MREALAVCHVGFEDLGVFENVLHDRGFQVTYVDAPRDPLLRRVRERDPALLVLLGGPIGAYEDASYPFLEARRHWSATGWRGGVRCSASASAPR